MALSCFCKQKCSRTGLIYTETQINCLRKSTCLQQDYKPAWMPL